MHSWLIEAYDTKCSPKIAKLSYLVEGFTKAKEILQLGKNTYLEPI
jgi:hypothetical protein